LFQTNTYKAFIKTLKVLLLLVVTGFIVYKLFYAYHIDTRFRDYQMAKEVGGWYYLALAIALMLVNWGLESLKWKYLIENFEPIDFSTAIKAVFSGVTLSVITPNQIGDFAGRVIHLEVMNKFRGIVGYRNWPYRPGYCYVVFWFVFPHVFYRNFGKPTVSFSIKYFTGSTNGSGVFKIGVDLQQIKTFEMDS
jgi:hypothetical protein